MAKSSFELIEGAPGIKFTDVENLVLRSTLRSKALKVHMGIPRLGLL